MYPQSSDPWGSTFSKQLGLKALIYPPLGLTGGCWGPPSLEAKLLLLLVSGHGLAQPIVVLPLPPPPSPTNPYGGCGVFHSAAYRLGLGGIQLFPCWSCVASL